MFSRKKSILIVPLILIFKIYALYSMDIEPAVPKCPSLQELCIGTFHLYNVLEDITMLDLTQSINAALLGNFYQNHECKKLILNDLLSRDPYKSIISKRYSSHLQELAENIVCGKRLDESRIVTCSFDGIIRITNVLRGSSDQEIQTGYAVNTPLSYFGATLCVLRPDRFILGTTNYFKTVYWWPLNKISLWERDASTGQFKQAKSFGLKTQGIRHIIKISDTTFAIELETETGNTLVSRDGKDIPSSSLSFDVITIYNISGECIRPLAWTPSNIEYYDPPQGWEAPREKFWCHPDCFATTEVQTLNVTYFCLNLEPLQTLLIARLMRHKYAEERITLDQDWLEIFKSLPVLWQERLESVIN